MLDVVNENGMTGNWIAKTHPLPFPPAANARIFMDARCFFCTLLGNRLRGASACREAQGI